MASKEEVVLRIFNTNARMSFRTLAKKLGIAPATAITRVKDLEEKGVIKGYRVETSPEKLGYRTLCYVEAQVGPNERVDFEQFLKRSPDVVSAHRVTGRYDYLFMVRFKDKRYLKEFLSKINHAPGVLKTNVKVSIDTLKEEYWRV